MEMLPIFPSKDFRDVCFKIDVIVWKSLLSNEVAVDGGLICFKIDVIVWKLTITPKVADSAGNAALK